MSDKRMFMPARDRARYDALLTWAQSVLESRDGDFISDMQSKLIRRTTQAVSGNDDDERVFAVLAEIGFAAVVDSMLAVINDHADGGAE